MNQYLGSISPPTDPELCDARLVAMSLALDNLVLVTSSILTGCQWLQVCQSIEITPYYLRCVVPISERYVFSFKISDSIEI